MVIVLQRVSEAAVEVGGQVVGSIGCGLCLLVGVEKGDGGEDARLLARKAADLRVFPDAEGRMNLALSAVSGEVLAVSQFTLAASVRKGRRPSFDGAEEPARAEELFREFVANLRELGVRVETGVFQAIMKVRLVNDGPVTFILNSKKDDRPEAGSAPIGG